jgi:hypothetical protein
MLRKMLLGQFNLLVVPRRPLPLRRFNNYRGGTGVCWDLVSLL